MSKFSSTIIALLIATSAPLICQEKVDRTFFSVIVSDIDLSMKWYKEKLKLVVKADTSMPERGIRQVNLMSDIFHVELIQIQSTPKPEGRFQGLFKVGTAVEHLDDWHSHLLKSKVIFRGDMIDDKLTGMRTFIILDPGSNRIQFFGK